MRGNIVIKILIAFLLLTIGWTLGQIFENISPFYLEWNISVSDVIAIIVELFLACYIARLIEKGVQDQRMEKDFFISEISETQQLLNELEKNCSRTIPMSFQLTVYEVEKIRKNLVRIWTIMKERNKAFYDKHNVEFEALLALVKDLNGQLTDSNYFVSEKGTTPVNITKGHIYLNLTVIPKIGRTFCILKDNLFNWKIRINNM